MIVMTHHRSWLCAQVACRSSLYPLAANQAGTWRSTCPQGHPLCSPGAHFHWSQLQWKPERGSDHVCVNRRYRSPTFIGKVTVHRSVKNIEWKSDTLLVTDEHLYFRCKWMWDPAGSVWHQCRLCEPVWLLFVSLSARLSGWVPPGVRRNCLCGHEGCRYAWVELVSLVRLLDFPF